MESKRFKIGYFADGPWSHKAFEKIIADKSIEVCFIVPRSDTTDGTLKRFAEEHNIDYLFPVRVNNPEFIEKARSYNCDLLVSMSFDQIFKQKILDAARLGIINCHAGMLPFYRGRNVLTWALINDEKSFGITVHFVDEGIDTGDIILQRSYPVIDSDTYQSLLETAYDACADILVDGLKMVQSGVFPRQKQSEIHPVGLYCGKRSVGDEIINWNSSSRQLFNFVRSVSVPGPGATTFINGEKVTINRAIMIPDAPVYINTPGQLLAKTKEGFYVKTQDSFIEIREIESTVKLKVGDKLGNYE